MWSDDYTAEVMKEQQPLSADCGSGLTTKIYPVYDSFLTKGT